jgi:hypothetical protein
MFLVYGISSVQHLLADDTCLLTTLLADDTCLLTTLACADCKRSEQRRMTDYYTVLASQTPLREILRNNAFSVGSSWLLLFPTSYLLKMINRGSYADWRS